MSETPRGRPIPTNEEVLADEIRDLEHPSLKSWIVWGVAFVGLIALVVVVLVFARIERSGEEARTAARLASSRPTDMSIRGPRGLHDHPPRLWRWVALDGASDYVVVVRALDGDEVVIQRPCETNYLEPTDIENANLVAGRYVWSVEARRADGSRMGYAEADFEISPFPVSPGEGDGG